MFSQESFLNKKVLVIFLALLLAGCNEPQLVTKNELMELTQKWNEPKVAIWYYTGSDDEYHYFRFVDLGETKDFKVRRDELEIKDTYALGTKRQGWRVMPWGTQAIRK